MHKKKIFVFIISYYTEFHFVIPVITSYEELIIKF